MRKLALVLLFGCALSWAGVACAQDDSPSLGDVARQARQQKQQKDAQVAKESQSSATSNESAQANETTGKAQTPKPPKKIITNEEIPEHFGPTRAAEPGTALVASPQQSGEQPGADNVKSQIVQIKNNIASLQSQIADLEQSVHYTGNNCVYGCAQWNENQQKKQQQVETMKQQLAQQQENLEHVQEMARKQGYGSSVYDP
jgi:hypothetical protein